MLANDPHSSAQVERPAQKLRVLLVEDEDLFARAVSKQLGKAGYDCKVAQTLADARTIVREFAPDLALLDMRLPDGNGMELLGNLTTEGVMVIVMTAYGDVSDAVSAMKQGAIDYLKKPVDLDELLLVVEKAQQSLALKTSLDHSRQRESVAAEQQIDFIGDSPAMQQVKQQIVRIAQLSAMTDAPAPTVLITGETGTGKDVAARVLHHSSDHPERPFVHVDCASLPGELIESELFGHEKGAYTNAQGARAGLIEAAEDGTLFLDEIGELPLPLQAKLLNVLERRMVRRLGSTKERPVAARFVAATNRDLQQAVLDGRFRADLFYRLNVLSITMPSLRERGHDKLLLARHFAAQTERKYALSSQGFTPDAEAAIEAYSWPGNVREMKHLIGRAVLLNQGSKISRRDLGLPDDVAITPVPNMVTEKMTLDQAEKTMLESALREARGNVSEAARQLGITRMAMRYRMEKHGLS